jgi:hypothetical protein
MIAARRLAAILAADVVCFSRLLGEDEGDSAGGLRTSRRGPSDNAQRERPFPPTATPKQLRSSMAA